ncbi:hypothetical protein GCM10011297_18680 [Bacterioplanes sanyensis]|uniref:DUF4124 domain-containing protein n=1 Tax=Bacterioplanes sanyensis TaxID=1249553 RepID=UPI00167995C1|nr:DUF4124 domain-containing protein [Bacterioplanes sanyensis]GGY46115.1 hypothetical protein GCM10011297_18680 [Bacterioplanes sanyensis]
MTKIFLSLSMLMALWLPAHMVLAEKIYRWVDENGQVHFSSQPRRGVDQDRYDVRIDRVEPPAEQTETETDSNETPQQETAATSGVDDAQAKELCDNARRVKDLISTNFSRRYRQEDGSVRPLTDEERKSKLETANQRIKDYCR